jgi:site-specific recombinase XerC
MADDDPAQERTLFIVATLFAMYLRVSDLVGRANWRPTMGDLRRDTTGNWWFHVVGKGNKAAKISVRDEYIERYLVRYRKSLQLSSPALTPRKNAIGHHAQRSRWVVGSACTDTSSDSV